MSLGNYVARIINLINIIKIDIVRKKEFNFFHVVRFFHHLFFCYSVNMMMMTW